MPAETTTDTFGGEELGRHERAEIDAPTRPPITGPSADQMRTRRDRSDGAGISLAELQARLGASANPMPGRPGRRRAAEVTDRDVSVPGAQHAARPAKHDAFDPDDLTRAAFAALIEALAAPADPEEAEAGHQGSPEDRAAAPARHVVVRSSLGSSASYTGRRRAPVPPRTGLRVGSRPITAHDADRRRRMARLLPIIAAMFLVLLTTGAATATRLAFASGPSQTSHGADVASLTTQRDDTRISRDKREPIETDQPAVGGVPEPTPSPTMIYAEPGSVPQLSGAGVAEQPATPIATETPAPEPPAPPAPVWVRPTIGGNMTSCFCTRWGTFHDGIDLDPPYGTPIYAVGDGVVVYAGPLSGYGIAIYIRHDNGDVTLYGHEKTSYVRTGDRVTAGQEIAFVANEGFSTGPHLHFSVYQGWVSTANHGTAIDPVPWLRERGVEIGPYNPNG